MKNALIYTIDDNRPYIDKTVNSINSFFHFNPERIDDTKVIVFSDRNKPLDHIRDDIDVKVVFDLTFDYSVLEFHGRPPLPVLYRFECFSNPIMNNIDVALSIDGDTEFTKACPELFKKYDRPTIGMGLENEIGLPGHNDLIRPFQVDKYFNMGFLLLTPKLIGKKRRITIFSDLLNLVARNPHFHWPDQDAISIMIGWEKYADLLQIMDDRYNFNKFCKNFLDFRDNKSKLDEIVMVHYAGGLSYKLRYI